MDQPRPTDGEELSKSEHDIVSECSHCSNMASFQHYGYATNTDRYISFHQPCLESPCSAFEALESGLCDSCRHLRLWHLVLCMEFEHRKGFAVIMIPGKDFPAEECRFCRMINLSMLSIGGYPAFAERPETYLDVHLQVGEVFHLEVDGVHEAGEVTACVSLMRPVEKDMGLMKIGDLQIVTRHDSNPRPDVSEMVSWTRVRRLMKACLEQHPQCLEPNSANLPETFRVIDVAQRCLIEKAQCGFVALSYVWGQDVDKSTVARKNNIEELRVPGNLSPDKLPQTLEDAIHVCEQLQERYLWIDRLCIIQDDPEDKALQIKAMDKIFSAARFVIVAAYGDGVNFGIPGIGRARWVTQISVDLPEMTATNHVHESMWDVLAVWRKYAWTYQEAVLARRKLHFTNTRMYLDCEQGRFHEDEFNKSAMVPRLDTWGQSESMQLRYPNDASNFDTYAHHVGNYSSRSLTFRSDAYAAFSGILSSLFGSDPKHYGMPLAYFDCALHWYLESTGDEVGLFSGTCSEPGFPSWTWYSRCGLHIRVDHRVYGFCGSLSAWYSHNVANNTMLPLNKQCDSLHIDKDWRVYMAIAYEAGCVSGSSNLSPSQEAWPDIDTSPGDNWSDYAKFYEGASAFVVDVSAEVRKIMQETPSAILGHLQFTSFDLDIDIYQQKLRITDSQGKTVGYLKGNYQQVIERWESQHASNYKGNRRFEFIGTMLRVLHSPGDDDWGENWRSKAYIQGNRRNARNDPVPVVMVMLIAWDGPIAYRKALGWVYLKDWIAAPRTWKTIILK